MNRPSPRPSACNGFYSSPALAIRELSTARSPAREAIEIVGHSPRLVETLKRISKLARYDEPAKTMFRAASPDFQTGLCTIAALYDGLPGLWERK